MITINSTVEVLDGHLLGQIMRDYCDNKPYSRSHLKRKNENLQVLLHRFILHFFVNGIYRFSLHRVSWTKPHKVIYFSRGKLNTRKVQAELSSSRELEETLYLILCSLQSTGTSWRNCCIDLLEPISTINDSLCTMINVQKC